MFWIGLVTGIGVVCFAVIAFIYVALRKMRLL
jgi:hypothetical protein